MCFVNPGADAATAVAPNGQLYVKPDPPDQRPFYSCLGGREYLAMYAGKWMSLVHDAKPTQSTADYWYAAEFQGFVQGIIFTTIKRGWCPGILESNDQAYTVVARYLLGRQARLPHDQSTAAVVAEALSARWPCKGSK